MPEDSLRILMLNFSPADVFGGVEQWMVRSSSLLIERGHTVHVITRPKSKLLSRLQDFNVPAHSSRSGVNYGPLSALRIASIARRHQLQIAIINFNKELTQVAVARRFSPIRKVVGRSVLPMMDTGKRHQRLYSRHLDGMITPSRGVKRTIEGYRWMNDVKVHNIPNGFDIGRVDRTFQKWSGRGAIRKRLNLSADTFTIGAIGRLERHKGFHHLIEAFRQVNEKNKDAFLILVGRGSERSALEAQVSGLGEIASKIRFMGHQTDIDPLLMSFDALVMPSTTNYETFGQSLIEAMAFYVPVIGSDVGGIPEIINHGENGLLVPPGDEASLAKALLKLIDDIELRRRLARAGRRSVENYYREETMIDRLEKYLSNLLRTP